MPRLRWGGQSTAILPHPCLGTLLILAALVGCSQVAAAPKKSADEALRPAHDVDTDVPDQEGDNDYFEETLIDQYGENLPLVILDRTPSTRLLRADYEPPETLVVAYEPDWRESITQIVAAAKDQAEVILLVLPEDRGRYTVTKLRAIPHVRVVETRIDSPWVRDYGPFQTYDFAEGVIWLDYGYGWDRPKDDVVPETLSELVPEFERAPLQPENIALDGGAVISNGKGLCAITEVSLTDAGISEVDTPAVQTFMRTLGCPTLAVLPEIPDETTGHADVIAQFLSPTVVAVASTDPRADVQLAEALDEAAARLAEAAELNGQTLDIVRVPIEVEGEAFYSYVNATRLKDRLLVPDFDRASQHTQRLAYALLRRALPQVRLVPIRADLMAERGGAVHCVTLGLGPNHKPPAELARPRGRPKPRG